MGSRQICSQNECQRSTFAQEAFCLLHAENATNLQDTYRSLIQAENLLTDLHVPGIHLNGIDLSHKTFINCDFQGATIQDCQLAHAHMTFCFFDQSSLVNLDFTNAKILESVFSCSTLSNIRFITSDIIQCNFNGAVLGECKFEACDLMYSRFLKSTGRSVIIEDCNLKGVYFDTSEATNFKFSYSNKEDAFFL